MATIPGDEGTIAAPRTYTLDDFLHALTDRLAIPWTEFNRDFLRWWIAFESGRDGIYGQFNPFNTTQDMPGAVSFNSHGVKHYSDFYSGVEATAKTLQYSNYTAILTGLRRSSFVGLFNDILANLSVWGSKDFVAALPKMNPSGLASLWPDPGLPNFDLGGIFGGLPGVPNIPGVPNLPGPGDIPGVDKVGDVFDKINPFGVAKDVAGSVQDIAKVFWTGAKILFDPHTWIRGGVIIFGGVLVIAGIWVYFNNTEVGKQVQTTAAKTAVTAVTKGAAKGASKGVA